MAKILFRALSTVSAVGVAAGVASVAAVSGNYGDDYGTTITQQTISTRQASGTLFGWAGIYFTVDALSDAARCVRPWYDIEHKWTVQGFSGVHSNLDSDFVIGGVDHRARNVSFGPEATFILPSGTWTIQLESWDGESKKTTTIEYVVLDYLDVFDAADIACVSTTGFTGKPTGAQEFSTIAAAEAYVEGRTNGALLLKKGETYTDRIDFSMTTGTRKCLVGTFGEASGHAILDMSGSGNTALKVRGTEDSITQLSIWGIRTIGMFDPTDHNWSVLPSGGGIDIGFLDDTHKTVHDCLIENAGGKGINTQAGTTSDFYCSNTRVDGWYDYALFFSDAGYFGFHGVSLKQPEGTRTGPGKEVAPHYADHGPSRVSRPTGPHIWSACDIRSRNSWLPSYRDYQPVIRWNTDIPNQTLIMERCRTDGMTIQFFNGVPTTAYVPMWGIIDRCHHVGTGQPGTILAIPNSGVVVRNSFIVVPDMLPLTSTGTRQVAGDQTGTRNTAENTKLTEIYSSVLSDLRSDAQKATINDSNSNRNFKPFDFNQIPFAESNNILWAPLISGGTTAVSPIDLTPQTSHVYPGSYWEQEPLDTDYAWATTASWGLYRPQTGSSAILGDGEKASLLDVTGQRRSEIRAAAGINRTNDCSGPYELALES